MDSKTYKILRLFPGSGEAGKKGAACMRLGLLAILFALSGLGQVFGQTPQYLVTGGTGSNIFPFNSPTTKRTQHIYLPGDLPGATAGNITRIYFKASTSVNTGTYSDFVVRLGQSTATVFPGAGSLDFFTGLTTVLSAASYTIPAPLPDSWVPIDLQTPFLYNPGETLIVDVEMSNRTSSTGFSVRTMTIPGAPNHKRLTANTVGATSGNGSTVWSDFGIDVVPAGPCTGAANPGTISGNLTTCPGQTTLQLSGYTQGAALQWQSSPDGITWADISGATTDTYTTPSLTASTYYRVNVTCGTTAASPAVQVLVGGVTAGTPPPGPVGYCASAANPVVLNVTGASSGSGIVYQWEESDDNGVTDPWANVVGGSGAATTDYTLPTNLTANRFYRLRVTCTNGNQTAVTAAVQVQVNLARLCYCITNLHVGSCTPSDHIDSVAIAGTSLINGSSGCTNSNGLAYSKFPASGNFTTTLMGGTTYTFSVTSTTNSIISLWIDFNQNGEFDPAEWKQIATSSTSGQPATAQMTIPTTARNGLTGMRIRTRGSGNPNSSGDACTPFGGGETEDYLITIAGGVGLQEELASAIQIYPNPNNGSFRVEVPNAAGKPMMLKLLNTLGQVVFSDATTAAYNQELNVSSIATGIYTLQVNLDGVVSSRKISIRK